MWFWGQEGWEEASACRWSARYWALPCGVGGEGLPLPSGMLVPSQMTHAWATGGDRVVGSTSSLSLCSSEADPEVRILGSGGILGRLGGWEVNLSLIFWGNLGGSTEHTSQ